MVKEITFRWNVVDDDYYLCYEQNPCFFVVFFLIFGGHEPFLWGNWYPYFWISGDVSSGFQSLIQTWWRHIYYMFPEIHFWWNTCQLLGSQHGRQANFVHIPVTRHCWGLNRRPIMSQANALPTELCRLGEQNPCFRGRCL